MGGPSTFADNMKHYTVDIEHRQLISSTKAGALRTRGGACNGFRRRCPVTPTELLSCMNVHMQTAKAFEAEMIGRYPNFDSRKIMPNGVVTLKVSSRPRPMRNSLDLRPQMAVFSSRGHTDQSDPETRLDGIDYSVHNVRSRRCESFDIEPPSVREVERAGNPLHRTEDER